MKTGTRDATESFIEMLPYFQMIQERWPDLNFADVNIVFCNASKTVFPEYDNELSIYRPGGSLPEDTVQFKAQEIDLELLTGTAGNIRIGYYDKRKALLIRK